MHSINTNIGAMVALASLGPDPIGVKLTEPPPAAPEPPPAPPAAPAELPARGLNKVDLKPGISPKVQLDEQKRQNPGKDWRYLHHQGAKEVRRRQKQAAKAAAKAAIEARSKGRT